MYVPTTASATDRRRSDAAWSAQPRLRPLSLLVCPSRAVSLLQQNFWGRTVDAGRRVIPRPHMPAREQTAASSLKRDADSHGWKGLKNSGIESGRRGSHGRALSGTTCNERHDILVGAVSQETVLRVSCDTFEPAVTRFVLAASALSSQLRKILYE